MSARSIEATDELNRTVAAIGTIVRRERKRRRLTVDALAKRSGVSFGRISELERGLGNPSLQTLQRVANSLDLPMQQLLADHGPDDEHVVRADQRYVMSEYGNPDEGPSVRRELLTPRGMTTLQVIRSTVPPHFTNEHAPFRHIGTESIFIVEGTWEIVHGKRRVTLRSGDAMSYRCSVPHYWANSSDRRCVLIGSFSPSED